MLVYYFMINAYNRNPLITILSGGAPPMDQSFIDRVYEGFEYERSRTGPPEDFPGLPLIPGGLRVEPRLSAMIEQ
jgi:hypothetical protein